MWIVTENLDFSGLGRLTTDFGRVIRAHHTAEAMIYIDRAKLDLRSRAIWAERVEVCETGRDGSSKDVVHWCIQVLSEAASEAGKKGDAQLVKSLLAAALLGAAATGNDADVQALLAKGAPLTARDTVLGRSPLMLAAAYGHASTLGLLLDKGANVNAVADDRGSLRRGARQADPFGSRRGRPALLRDAGILRPVSARREHIHP